MTRKKYSVKSTGRRKNEKYINIPSDSSPNVKNFVPQNNNPSQNICININIEKVVTTNYYAQGPTFWNRIFKIIAWFGF